MILAENEQTAFNPFSQVFLPTILVVTCSWLPFWIDIDFGKQVSVVVQLLMSCEYLLMFYAQAEISECTLYVLCVSCRCLLAHYLYYWCSNRCLCVYFWILTGIPGCTVDGDVLCTYRYPWVYCWWWCSIYLQVSLGVLLMVMFYVLTGIPGYTVDGDVLCTYRYPWVYCWWWCSMCLQVSLGVLLMVMFYVLTGIPGCTVDVLVLTGPGWCFFYPWGRVWVQHLSLSSGHRWNDIRQWPSSLIPWLSQSKKISLPIIPWELGQAAIFFWKHQNLCLDLNIIGCTLQEGSTKIVSTVN